jgi:hypothetical protein
VLKARDKWSAEMKDFLAQSVKSQPVERPSASELLKVWPTSQGLLVTLIYIIQLARSNSIDVPSRRSTHF